MNEKYIKLSVWAERHGINYQTAYRWYKADKLPVKSSMKTPTGTILVEKIEVAYDDTLTVEIEMSNEALPLARRLVSAYKFIQAQSEKENSRSDPYDEKIVKMDLKKMGSEDVSDEEKQKILKNLYLSKNNPYNPFEDEKNAKIRNDKQKTKTLADEVFILQEDKNVIKQDVQELMSEVFGEGKNFIDRIMARVDRKLNELKQKIKDAKSLEELQKSIEITEMSK